MKILNVGCGYETYGTHFIDNFTRKEGIIKCDVSKEPLPFEDNYFDEVYSRNLFEHLSNPELFLKECYRVLKPNCKLILITDSALFSPFYWNRTLSKWLNYKIGYNFVGAHDTYKSCYDFIRDANLEISRTNDPWEAMQNINKDDKHFAVYTKMHLINHLKLNCFKIESVESGVFQTLDKKLLSVILSLVTKYYGYPRIKIVGVKT